MLLETIPVLDALTTGTPTTYYEEGNWRKQEFAGKALAPSASGAKFTTFGTQAGSYWNAASFGTTQAVSIKNNETTDLKERFWELWCCYANTHSGYKVRFTREATETTVVATLFSVTTGTESLLGTSSAITTTEAGFLFGLLREPGKIKAYTKAPAGAWTLAVEAANSTFTTGFLAFGGQGSDPLFTAFSGGEPAAEIHRAPPRSLSTPSRRKVI